MSASGAWPRWPGRLPPEASQSASLGTTAGDVVELVLANHAVAGSLFTTLDARPGPATRTQVQLEYTWRSVAGLLELNADAVEEICYPVMFGRDLDGLTEMERATADHNDIREAIYEAQLAAAGSAAWWRAVDAARKASTDHFAGQERAALIGLRRSLPLGARLRLGAQWSRYIAARVMDRPSPSADA
jgi:hypothetical protein